MPTRVGMAPFRLEISMVMATGISRLVTRPTVHKIMASLKAMAKALSEHSKSIQDIQILRILSPLLIVLS